MGVAALSAWLVTAGGFFLFGTWVGGEGRHVAR